MRKSQNLDKVSKAISLLRNGRFFDVDEQHPEIIKKWCRRFENNEEVPSDWKKPHVVITFKMSDRRRLGYILLMSPDK